MTPVSLAPCISNKADEKEREQGKQKRAPQGGSSAREGKQGDRRLSRRLLCTARRIKATQLQYVRGRPPCSLAGREAVGSACDDGKQKERKKEKKQRAVVFVGSYLLFSSH